MSTSIKTKLKAHLLAQFSKENYYQACIDLEEFTFESYENILFSIFSSKDYQDYRTSFIIFYFNQHLHKSKYFEEIIQSPRRRELFEILFDFKINMGPEFHPGISLPEDRSLKCPELYKRLCFEYPEAMMMLLKRHRLPFLYKEHFIQIAEIMKDAKTPEGLFQFGKKMLDVSIIEASLYHNFGHLAKIIVEKPIEQVFALAAVWLHYYTWDLAINKNNEDAERHNETTAIEALNVILSYVLAYRKRNETTKIFDPVTFQKELIDSNQSEPPYYEIFIAAIKWKHFVNTYVDELCFEDDCTVEFEERGLVIYHDQKSREEFEYTNWKYYAYDRNYKGIDENDLNDFELDSNQRWFLKEIGPLYVKEMRQAFDEFINEIYVKEYGIKTEHLIPFCITNIIWWRLGFRAIVNEGIKHRSEWKAIIQNLMKHEIERINNQLPLTLVSDETLYGVNMETQNEFTEEIVRKCVDACLLNIDTYKAEKFNRYKPPVNLFHSIWYKINGKMYCFPQISASMNTHTFFSNLALIVHRKEKIQKQNDKKATDQMENFISELADKKGFLTAKKRQYEFAVNTEKFRGEIDAVLYDGKKLLGIEFKRSALRGNLEDISYEKEIVLEGAARQLDRFKKYVRTLPFDLNKKMDPENKLKMNVDFGKMEIEGLIITTNFEHDHKLVQGKYMKISWVEWLWIMKDIKKGASIDAILTRIKNNTYWSEVIGI